MTRATPCVWPPDKADTLRSETRHAQSLGAIERAAERFGKSVGGWGLRILLALATVVGAKQIAKTSGPAGGSAPAPVAVSVGQGGAGAMAVPVVDGIRITVTADGAVVLVHGGMTAHAVASGPGGGSSPAADTAHDATKAAGTMPRDFVTRNTMNKSAKYASEREARALARTKLGRDPIQVEPGKLRSQDGRWQYRGKLEDVQGHGRGDTPHIHLERLDPKTGEVLENWHLRW